MMYLLTLSRPGVAAEATHFGKCPKMIEQLRIFTQIFVRIIFNLLLKQLYKIQCQLLLKFFQKNNSKKAGTT